MKTLLSIAFIVVLFVSCKKHGLPPLPDSYHPFDTCNLIAKINNQVMTYDTANYLINDGGGYRFNYGSSYTYVEKHAVNSPLNYDRIWLVAGTKNPLEIQHYSNGIITQLLHYHYNSGDTNSSALPIGIDETNYAADGQTILSNYLYVETASYVNGNPIDVRIEKRIPTSLSGPLIIVDTTFYHFTYNTSLPAHKVVFPDEMIYTPQAKPHNLVTQTIVTRSSGIDTISHSYVRDSRGRVVSYTYHYQYGSPTTINYTYKCN